MRLLLLVSVLVLSSLSFCFPTSNTQILTEDEYITLFIRWMIQNAKSYEREQFTTRYSLWRSNLALIEQHNVQYYAGNTTFSLSLNVFADWTEDEKIARNGFKVPQTAIQTALPTTPRHLPPSLDWRTRGAVNPVLDQGACGSCYSFSAVGAMEGAWAIKHSQLLQVSQQEIVDCSFLYGNAGCNGGLPDTVFEYVISNGGISDAASSPYTGVEGPCYTSNPVMTISDYVNVATDEISLLAAVAIGPVSVGIQANHMAFQYYSGGVFSDASCGTYLDHAVLIVGYGTDSISGLDYWIVRNSWGSGWGESGYIRMIRNTNSCGIALLSSYPVV